MREGIVRGGELKDIYDMRPQVKTTNFMMKRNTDCHILSKLEGSRVSQAYFKMLAHNLIVVATGDSEYDFREACFIEAFIHINRIS